MSNTARKARKRAGIKFEKAQKVATVRTADPVVPVEYIAEKPVPVRVSTSLSAEEFATVQRFGLDQPDGKLEINHLAFGFAFVIVAALVVLVGIAVGVWVVLS